MRDKGINFRTDGLGIEGLVLLEAADEIQRLRNALKPFARKIDTDSEKYIANGPADGWCAAVSYQVQDYREARAALNTEPKDQNND
jgi:hypothetical protein